MANEWVVLLAALTGAGGAIFAQVVASVFASRRDGKRLEWEVATHEREWDRQQTERFRDIKRGLYSRFLGLTYDAITNTSTKLNEERRTKKYQSLDTNYSEHEDELNDLRWNIKLVAPVEVFTSIELVNTLAILSQTVFYRPDKFSAKHRRRVATDALAEWQDLSHLMRVDLSSRPDELESVANNIKRRRKLRNSLPDTHPEPNSKLQSRLDELHNLPTSFPPVDPDGPGD